MDFKTLPRGYVTPGCVDFLSRTAHADGHFLTDTRKFSRTPNSPWSPPCTNCMRWYGSRKHGISTNQISTTEGSPSFTASQKGLAAYDPITISIFPPSPPFLKPRKIYSGLPPSWKNSRGWKIRLLPNKHLRTRALTAQARASTTILRERNCTHRRRWLMGFHEEV